MFVTEHPDTRPIRVIVADSSHIHSQLLADGMRRDGRLHVFSARNPAEFSQAAAQARIDVGVISSTLDEPGDGFEVLRTFRASHPNIPTVMLLESSKRETVVEAFRAGARGVLGKQTSLVDLCKCIHCVHDGQIWASSTEMLFALDVLASSPSISAVDHRGMSLLTDREMEVVTCLAEGLTNREIGERLGLSRHTVKNYLFRIFDKVGVSSRVELLHLTLRQPAPARNCLSDSDHVSEFEICQKAASDGSPTAQIRLAELLYLDGQGTQKDYIAAYMWYLLSERSIADLRERANAEKSKLLSLMLPQEIVEARQRANEWLKKPQDSSSAVSSRSPLSQKALASSR